MTTPCTVFIDYFSPPLIMNGYDTPLPGSPRSARPRRRGRPPRVAAPSLTLLGLALGLAGALFYAWVLNPIVYSQATPARLGETFQAEYIYLVSQSYAVDKNWAQAQQRLAALDEPDTTAAVAAQLEAALRQGKEPQTVRDLAALAAQLGVQGQAVSLFAPVAAAATLSPTPIIIPTFTPTLLPTLPPPLPPTATPQPTTAPTRPPTPLPTPAPAYRLLSQRRACRFDQPVNVIEVVVVDALLQPLPGVEVLVAWTGGTDHFFTGFTPAEGPGYADFTMSQANVSYSVTLPEGSPTVSGLRPEQCEARDGGLMGGWRLTFQRLTEPLTATAEP